MIFRTIVCVGWFSWGGPADTFLAHLAPIRFFAGPGKTKAKIQIENYQFGAITINGKVYENDILIFPDRVVPEWWRKESHQVQLDDLGQILDFKPELVIFGTGSAGRMEVPQALIDTLRQRNIECIAENTAKACELLNGELRQGTKVAGAFHVTC